MDIVNENSAQVCEYSTNSRFHLNGNATINPPLNSIHVGQMSCGEQVVNSMSEIDVPVSVDINLDVNKNSSGLTTHTHTQKTARFPPYLVNLENLEFCHFIFQVWNLLKK